MNKLLFLLGLAIFSSEIVLAQKEINNWLFGQNAWLGFGTGVPLSLPGSNMTPVEGCSSISDELGNLLFYTDGSVIWNRNHQPMPNGSGLSGDSRITQTVLITYYPGNKDLYYVFTVNTDPNSGGFAYSIVDMRLNGGLGDVDVTRKNVSFNLPVTEKLSAVKHKNGRDIWLVVHMFNSDAFFVYPIDCKGLLAFPSVYNIGSVISNLGNAPGYLKFSPDGKTMVAANTAGDFELFDFDNSTGQIGNFRAIPASTLFACGPYGVEFSPDSKLLYVSELRTCTAPISYVIAQYKLDPDINATIASRVVIDSGNSNFAGALLLGPDNKIYTTYNRSTNIGVIDFPNIYGTGCNFSKQDMLQPPAYGWLGLPNVIAGFKRTTLADDTTICDGSALILKLGLPSTTYLWNDGSVADSLIVTTPGKYWVELTTTNGNGDNCPITDTITVAFQTVPKFTLGNDTLICQDKFPLLLAPSVPGATLLWQDSSTNATFPVTVKGLYWLQATINNCSIRDSININSAPVVPFSLGADTAICSSDSLLLTANVTATSYLWNTGEVSKSIMVKTAGIYWCEATFAGCSYRDTINVSLKLAPVVNLGNDTALCQYQFPFQLNQSIPGAAYLWQDGSTGNSFVTNAGGKYWLRATLNGCSASDTIAITANPVITFNLGADTTICSNNPFVLTVNPSFSNYLWSDGSTSRSISVTTSGIFWCEARSGTGCVFRDSIKVTYNPQPVINLGNDTTVCQNAFPFSIGKVIPGASYAWQDGSNNASYSVTGPGTYWQQATINGCSARDSIIVSSSPSSVFSLGADTSICSTGPYTLKANINTGSYLWNTGATTQSITVTTSGIYWCEVNTGTACSYRDSITIVLSPPVVVSLGKDTSICQTSFPFLIGQSITGASYLWQDGSRNSTYPVTGAGTYWLQATVNGCSTRDSIIIASSPLPVFSLGADTTICSSGSYTLKANITAGSYLWSTGAITQSIIINNSGVYWCEVNSGTACSYRDSIKITLSAPVVFSLGKDTSICPTSFPFTVGQTIAGASYLWQDGSINASYSAAGPGTYWLQATVNGCSARDSIVIAASPSSVFSLGADTTICSTGSYTLKVPIPAGSYLWNTGANTQSITITTAGLYWCEINLGTGCSYRDTIRVTFASPIVFSLGKDTIICQNTPLLLDVTNAGDAYLWQDNSVRSQYTITKSGIYYVTVTRGSCSKSDSIVVTYGTQLLPNLGVDKSICPGETLLLDPNVSATSYLWQDGSTNRTFKVTQPGTYKVQVINQCGASADEMVVSTGACKLMIPNAFTPGKGPNNMFRVLNAGDLKDFNLRVFNRWGQQVYGSSKTTEGWDGKYKGVDQPTETYIYTLSYTDIVTGKKVSQKGIVVLVR